MQAFAPDAIDAQAQAFLDVWFETRRIVQTLNFNRFQQEGLSAPQFILLNMLGEGEAGAAELARRLNVDVTTTMRTAASLEARGLISRLRDPADRRRSRLTLTDEGRTAHARLHRLFVERVTSAFRAMPPSTRSGLIEGLRMFVAAAENETLAGSPRR